jgi:hypothetical protein
VRDSRYVPVKSSPASDLGGYAKTFDLLGKLVNLDRVTNNSNAASQSSVGNLPAGFYVKARNDNKKAGAAVAPKK